MDSSDLGGAGEVEFWRAEAERLATDNVVLQTRVADLEGQVSALTEKVTMLARLAFGTSSEKAAAKPTTGDDGTAGGSCGDDSAGDGIAGGKAKRGRGQRRGSRGHGLWDYSQLPTREEIHDVPEAECGAHAAARATPRSGEEGCEQIDWQVQLTRIVYRRPAYRRTCRRCAVLGVLVAPPVPKAIAKDRFTSGSWPPAV